MSSETLHTISVAFFISGLAFLMLTIIFAFKFNLISMLKSSRNIRKEKMFSDGKEYFAYVENKKKNSFTYNTEKVPSEITENSFDSSTTDNDNDVSGTVVNLKKEPQTSSTMLRPKEEQHTSGTMVRPKEEPHTSATVLRPKEEPQTSATVLRPKEEPQTSATVLRPKEESQTSATVIRSNNDQSNTTVLISKKPEPKRNENEFIIIKEIMVINGNPDEVTKRHLSR